MAVQATYGQINPRTGRRDIDYPEGFDPMIAYREMLAGRGLPSRFGDGMTGGMGGGQGVNMDMIGEIRELLADEPREDWDAILRQYDFLTDADIQAILGASP